MTTWTARAKQRMKELNITHLKMAKHLEVSRASITHYLSGRREPSLNLLLKWAAILKTTPAWLQFGVDSSEKIAKNGANFKSAPPTSTYLPVISWREAAQWQTLVKKYHSDKSTEQIPYAGDPIPDGYALQIHSDSMEALHGISFIQNSYIVVSPKRIAKHGDFVVVRNKKEKEAFLRQLVIESKQRFLKPLNPRYPLVEMKSNFIICGVVCQTFQKF